MGSKRLSIRDPAAEVCDATGAENRENAGFTMIVSKKIQNFY
jgi:hypothetical protein